MNLGDPNYLSCSSPQDGNDKLFSGKSIVFCFGNEYFEVKGSLSTLANQH
jgi:hypothetical protein